jgi:FkbM family methyltransferase
MYEAHKLEKTDTGPGDIVIDCGASVGEVTAYFCLKGAEVYAFEPNKYAFQVLKRRFSGYPNVHCVQKGVSAPELAGTAKLYLHEHADSDQLKYSTGSSIRADKCNVDVQNYLEVQLLDLCSFINILNRPIKVLKIDIEGAEMELVDSLIEQKIAHKIDHIFVETHEKKIPSLRKPLELLKEKIKREGLTNIDLTWR